MSARRTWPMVVMAMMLSGCGSRTDPPVHSAAATAATPGALVIAYAPDSADTFSAVSTDSITALDWLENICDSLAVPLELKKYPFGDLVVGIGGKHNGSGGNWLYEVNAAPVAKAASAYRVSPHDTVRFRFQ